MNLPGGFELVIILIIVVILFGVGRVGKIAGEMGKGIREFRTGLKGDDEAVEEKVSEESDQNA
jgi:sec-independent protein translocase protein TatA